MIYIEVLPRFGNLSAQGSKIRGTYFVYTLVQKSRWQDTAETAIHRTVAALYLMRYSAFVRGNKGRNFIKGNPIGTCWKQL